MFGPSPHAFGLLSQSSRWLPRGRYAGVGANAWGQSGFVFMGSLVVVTDKRRGTPGHTVAERRDCGQSPGVRRKSIVELQDLREQSFVKVLLRGESGTGKTYNCCCAALELAGDGYDVLYVDTESQATSTLLKLVEGTDYSESDLEGIEYESVENLEQLEVQLERSAEFDVLVFDTLDHKHSMVLKRVTDAKKESDADWNQYPSIYSGEKQIMQELEGLQTHVIATVDPESGSENKPKGAQTNVQGYFDLVVDMLRENGEYSNRVFNWIGHAGRVGKEIPDVAEAATIEIANHSGDK